MFKNTKINYILSRCKKNKNKFRYTSNDINVNNMGITKEIVPSSRRIIIEEVEKKPISSEKWMKLKIRSPRKRKKEISTMR